MPARCSATVGTPRWPWWRPGRRRGRTPTRPEIAWLQPVPDALFAPPADDPAAVAEYRQRVRPALVAALQYLPARQRAVLILRDVLAWRAAETAELPGTSTAAVNSALQRAREQVAGWRRPPRPSPRRPTGTGATCSTGSRRVRRRRPGCARRGAHRRRDVRDAADADLVRRPGHGGAFTRFARHGAFRTLPTAANGQPALALYWRKPDGGYRLHAVHVLEPTPRGIARVVMFSDPAVMDRFALPPTPLTGGEPGAHAAPSRRAGGPATLRHRSAWATRPARVSRTPP